MGKNKNGLEKDKKKKVSFNVLSKKGLMGLVLAGVMVASPVMLTGCSGEKGDVGAAGKSAYELAVENGFEGTMQEWLESLIGESGESGDSVEFRATETHIQWKYVGEGVWKDLISFDNLKQKENVVDVEVINQRGFELFQSKLNGMNSNYKVSYEYADNYIVESFLNYGVYLPRLQNSANPDEWLWYTNILNMRISMQYNYNTKVSVPDEGIDWFSGYSLNIVGETAYGKTPTNVVTATCKYQNDIEEYKCVTGGGSLNYYSDSNVRDEDFNYEFVKVLKSFKYEDVLKCEFNEAGDCVISFKFSGNNNSDYPMNNKYTYEFYVNKDGEVIRCYVYEKGFLDSETQGDLYCKISYEKGESLIDKDLLDEIFEIEKEQILEDNPSLTCEDWYDLFFYEEKWLKWTSLWVYRVKRS